MIRKHCCVLSILCSQQEAPVCPARSIPFFYILNHFLHMVGDQWNKYSLNQWANKWRNWPFQTKFVYNLCPQFRGPSYDSHSVWSSNACSQTRKACITQAQRSRKPGKKNLANTDMYPAIPCKKKMQMDDMDGVSSLRSSRILNSQLKLRFRWNLQELCPACTSVFN